VYCINCGEEVVQAANFCAACGEKIQRLRGEEQRSERSVSMECDVDSEENADLNTPVVEPPTDSPAFVGPPLRVNAPNSPDTTPVAKTDKEQRVERSVSVVRDVNSEETAAPDREAGGGKAVEIQQHRQAFETLLGQKRRRPPDSASEAGDGKAGTQKESIVEAKAALGGWRATLFMPVMPAPPLAHQFSEKPLSRGIEQDVIPRRFLGWAAGLLLGMTVSGSGLVEDAQSVWMFAAQQEQMESMGEPLPLWLQDSNNLSCRTGDYHLTIDKAFTRVYEVLLFAVPVERFGVDFNELSSWTMESYCSSRKAEYLLLARTQSAPTVIIQTPGLLVDFVLGFIPWLLIGGAIGERKRNRWFVIGGLLFYWLLPNLILSFL